MAAVDVMHLGETTRIEATAKKRRTGAIMDVSGATNTIVIRPPGGDDDGSEDLTFTADFNNDPESASTNDGVDGVFGYTLAEDAFTRTGLYQWQAKSDGPAGHYKSDIHTLRVVENLGS